MLFSAFSWRVSGSFCWLRIKQKTGCISCFKANTVYHDSQILSRLTKRWRSLSVMRSMALPLLALWLLIVSRSEANIFDIDASEYYSDQTHNEVKDDVVKKHIIPFITMFPKSHGEKSPVYDEEGNFQDVGEPLILTPYLEAGKIKEAQEKAAVTSLPGTKLESYSGFFTVNKAKGSNLFFWFFPAQNQDPGAPTIVWLQGGPGGSSMMGLFVENGPFSVTEGGDLKQRNTSWNLEHGTLFVDQPAGTGFSFTNGGYCEDMDCVGRDLYELLQQFYQLFPKLRPNELYVTGESYAGKYVPAISHKIHVENQKGSRPTLNFAGMAIGDGLCDPINQLGYADFLFETGLVIESGRAYLKKAAEETKKIILAQNWTEATQTWEQMTAYFTSHTGLNFYYNYLLQDQPVDFNYHIDFLHRPAVRKAIHVGDLPFDEISMPVHDHLYADMTKTVAPWIENLLDAGYKVLIYNGQLDVIVAYPATEEFIGKLKWKGAAEYSTTDRGVWKVGPSIAGYAREVGSFTQLMVRNAGHILPYDQPQWALDMIRRFVKGESFKDSQPGL